MSVKNNALLAAAALALGLVVEAGASPICEGLLNDLTITAFGSAEVDATGKAVVFVSVTDGATTKVRPVADSLGNVKTYMDAAAVMVLAKKTNLAPGTQIKIVKFVKDSAVGDPLLALKAKYKAFKSEVATGVKSVATVAGKVTAAQALGWDTAVGTPENAEYLDLVARGVSIGEWKTYCDAKVVALAASLTAAGIDPATVV